MVLPAIHFTSRSVRAVAQVENEVPRTCSPSQQIHEAGIALLAAAQIPAANIAALLNATLNQFLAWPFRAGPARRAYSEGDAKEGWPLTSK
jgi:hypothetical protein